MGRSKVKPRSHHDIARLHPLTNDPTKYIFPTPLQFLRYGPIFCLRFYRIKVTAERSKVKSRLYYDTSYLEAPTNVPTTYQLPTPHGFHDIAQTRFYRSRSLLHGQRSNRDHTMHNYSP